MNQSDFDNNKNGSNLDNKEISLNTIINFLKKSWLNLVVAGIFGSVFGLGVWYFEAPYVATYSLYNSANNININLNLIEVDSIKKNLPNIAYKMTALSRNIVSPDQGYYREFSELGWWQKNVIPTYEQSESKSIVSLTFLGISQNKEDANLMAKASANFFRSGAAYLKFHNEIKASAIKSVDLMGEIETEIKSIDLNLKQKQARIKLLENLKISYPGARSENVIIGSEKSAKYLPLETQIIGEKISINESSERLSELRLSLSGLKAFNVFLAEALLLETSKPSGLALGVELLKLEARFREQLIKGGLKNTEQFDHFRQVLLRTQAIYFEGLEDGSPPDAIKPGKFRSVLGGSLSGFLLMLLILLAKRWHHFFKNDN